MTRGSDSGASLRLVIDRPRQGAMNMALEEALLEQVGAGPSPPTLRLYRWDPPTVSLGYFQTFAEYEQLAPPAGELDVVRRLTGGGAILHDLELTYSLALPLRHVLLSDGANALYGKMHQVIRRALAGFGVSTQPRGPCEEDSVRSGPFLCFSRKHSEDLMLGGGKLAGSAQRRTARGVLQHGSIILGSRFAQQECAPAGLETTDERIGELAESISTAFASLTGLSVCPGQWSESEMSRAGELRTKYESDQWNRLR